MAKLYGAQRLVLQTLIDNQENPSQFVDEQHVSQLTQLSITDLRDWFLTLDQDEYVDLALTAEGMKASATPKGRLVMGLHGSSPKVSVPVQSFSRTKTGRERSLVVGISNYAPPVSKLPAVANDVREMKKLLGSDRGLFEPGNICCLADDDATKDATTAVLADTFSNVGADDAVFVYLAGHGSVVGDEYFFVTHDTAPDDIARTGVPLSYIKSIIDESKSQRAFLWLDFCYSGGIVPRGSDQDVIGRTLEVVQGNGKLIVAACTPSQLAWESSTVGHGLFTNSLLNGLRGEAMHNGEITINSLFDYIDRSMGSERQRPTLFGQMTGRIVLVSSQTSGGEN